MAKAKNPSSGLDRLNIAMERAENGSIVRVSGEGNGKDSSYTSHTFIAPNGRAALRIATMHMRSMGNKLKSKKGKSKARSTKR